MNRKIIIKGSSNRNGNTQKIIDSLNANNDFDVIDLLDYTIGHFDYDFKNSDDDFIPLMEKVIEQYDTIIFATPVYWYSMSGILKVFFDRISDLLHYKKELGRQLRGKSMGMISNSNDNDRFSFFNKPFIESANYLGMNYLGDIHTWFDGSEIHDDANKIIDTFRQQIHTH
ncbi:MAG: NAD(P)H-dependent oxidoreductase [Flavobacteriaceae bacterium]